MTNRPWYVRLLIAGKCIFLECLIPIKMGKMKNINGGPLDETQMQRHVPVEVTRHGLHGWHLG